MTMSNEKPNFSPRGPVVVEIKNPEVDYPTIVDDRFHMSRIDLKLHEEMRRVKAYLFRGGCRPNGW